jgi:cobyric acid synthase
MKPWPVSVIDISGRPYLSFNASFSKEKVGSFDVELVEEFFHGLVINARYTAHIDLIRGGNTHHENRSHLQSFCAEPAHRDGRFRRAALAFLKRSDRMIAIVDYGLGNIANLTNAIRFLGYETILTHEEAELRKADVIVLPGVGHFKDAIERIDAIGLRELLTELEQTKPFIGICLGMQLLFEHSEEGDVDGLGFLRAK